MHILVLWAPLADYTVACFSSLAKKENIQLSLVYQAGETNAPYNQFDLSFCKNAINGNNVTSAELKSSCKSLDPDVIIMASWNYKLYMSIAKYHRIVNKTYVVSTFDRQWIGNLKQRFGILISNLFLKPSIDNFFVSGDRQSLFARKLGYKNPLQGYYSANTLNFYEGVNLHKREFIFVGRLVAIKGVEQLITAYKKYRSLASNPWPLIICGAGNLSYLFNNVEGVTVMGFLQPAELRKKLSESSCLILPSFFEPWGLVIHEAALAGLAIICSPECGAATYFVRDGQNGFIVNADAESLCGAIMRIDGLSDEQLNGMFETSRVLGNLWTTTKWADYVYENICLANNRR